MAAMNTVSLIGNLTRDWEVVDAAGTMVAKSGLAINDRDKTIFVDIQVWAKQAETASKFTHRGSLVAIDGRLTFDTWEKDGQKRSKLYVTANRVVFLDPANADAPVKESTPAPLPAADDDLPF
jgi:single-strand DNA-binding protein